MQLYDTLTRAMRELPPPPGPIRMYFCGPTVYARAHIGNARPFVLGIWLRSWLRERGYDVELVHNITDINDKIYAAAPEGSAELAEEAAGWYLQDTGDLGLGMPDALPKATDYVPQIVRFIAELVDGEFAYPAGGDVYFRVASFGDYGKLSNRRLEEMDQGEDDVAGSAAVKESPHDFALWKAHKEGEDTAWDAPWGRGRPGWHIECSAMAEAELGMNFAIHGGGSDLVFPHHENEIAQSEAARGVPLARIWMHNGMVEIDAEKMSKSEGNIFQLSEALERYGREVVVNYLISGHYRKPLDFSEQELEESASEVERLRNFLREKGTDGAPGDEAAAYRERFLDALGDDFNTPTARAEAFELVAEANRRELPGAGAALVEMLEVLGLETLARPEEAPDPEALELLAEREEAREERDFERADGIRDQLAEQGWEVRDGPEGARLVRRS